MHAADEERVYRHAIYVPSMFYYGTNILPPPDETMHSPITLQSPPQTPIADTGLHLVLLWASSINTESLIAGSSMICLQGNKTKHHTKENETSLE